jgi:outer membrane immunogenic protein
MRRIALASVATITIALIALIAGPRSVSAAPVNWTGFYIGGNLGYGWGSDTGSGFNSFTDIPVGGSFFGAAGYFGAGGNVLPGVTPKGVIGGGQIGYNWQNNPAWVWGLVADFQASGMKDSASATVTPPGFVNTIQTNDSKIDWFGTVRGRAGFTSANWLLYGTGGLAYGKVRTDTRLDCAPCAPPQFFAGSTSQTKAGWTLGAGLELAMFPHWTVGAEYLYFDLGKITTTAALVSGTNSGTTFASESAFRGSIVRMTFNYKFAP